MPKEADARPVRERLATRYAVLAYHVHAGRIPLLAAGRCGRRCGHVKVDDRAVVRLYCAKRRGHGGHHWPVPPPEGKP